MSNIPLYILYVLVVWLTIFLGYILLKRTVRQMEKKRLVRVKENLPPSAVKTSLTKINKESIQESGKRGIIQRFSVIRISLISFFVVLAFLLSLAPYWNRLPTQAISILVTVATVILGIAAKPIIENIMAGIVMTLSRQFRTGDTVMIDSEYGSIEDISITHTTIKIWDWRRYIIPNSLMLSKECINYTIADSYLWAYTEFWVSPNADMTTVETLAKKAVTESALYWDIEEPKFWVMNIEKDSLKCWVAGWAKNPQNAWILKHQIRKNLATLLQKHNILSNQNNVYFDPKSKVKRI